VEWEDSECQEWVEWEERVAWEITKMNKKSKRANKRSKKLLMPMEKTVTIDVDSLKRINSLYILP